MAKFKKVNIEGQTVMLNIDNVLMIEEAADPENDCAVVVLSDGSRHTTLEVYAELLEDWGIQL